MRIAFRVFHDPLASLNFEGFDPQTFLNDPQNLLFTFFNSYKGGHCDPFKRKLRENPGPSFALLYEVNHPIGTHGQFSVSSSTSNSDVSRKHRSFWYSVHLKAEAFYCSYPNYGTFFLINKDT